MYTQNLLIGVIAALLSLLGFVLAIMQERRLSSNPGTIEKLKRALLTGTGFLIFVISGAPALDYLGSPTAEKMWDIRALSSLTCFAIPIGLLTTAGSYLWYSRKGTTRI